MNILLVDDEITMLRILQKVVDWHKLGIENVFTARNAEQARAVLQEQAISLTLCDIEMPQENGLKLIAWIQGIYPSIVNIILTGHADFNYARSAISLGVYRFLLKPVSFQELEQTLQDAVDKLEEEENAGPGPGDAPDSDQPSMTQTVKNYLESHYNEIITRAGVESLVHLNRDYINREFKEHTGYTLMEYIQYYRIRTAKKLLRETNLPVVEICTRVGYDSPAYFSKIFKRRTGLTPVEYRGRQEGENGTSVLL
jgi:YesN/AraC family two-component response regulator